MRKILFAEDSAREEGIGSLLDVLETAGMKGESIVITVESNDGQSGEIVILDGAVHSIRAGSLTGEEALKRMFSWRFSQISLSNTVPSGYEQTEDCCPVQALLIEFAQNIPILQTGVGETSQTKEDSMASIDEQVQSVLLRMMERVGKLEGVMLVDNDGFVISNVGQAMKQEEAEMVGGIITALAGMTSKVAQELSAGEVDRVMLHGKDRHIFLSRASSEFSLVTIARSDASLGLVFSEIKRVGPEIKKIMGEV